MAVINLCLGLSFAMSVALAISLIYLAVRRSPKQEATKAADSSPELAANL